MKHGMLQNMVDSIVKSGSQNSDAKTFKLIRHLTDPFCYAIAHENVTKVTTIVANVPKVTTIVEVDRTSLFGQTQLSPAEVGGIVLPLSLLLLGLALFGIVKLLRLLLESSIKERLMAIINQDFDSYLKKYLHGYLRILIGAGITILLQSSSIFTSTLVPMAGTGLIEVDTIYPLFMGANLGTTVSTFVAASAVSENEGEYVAALQAALIHFFLNLFGVLIFYPLPFLR